MQLQFIIDIFLCVSNFILFQTYPNVFHWVGEINMYKHALAPNGFFEPHRARVTVQRVKSGEYDDLFNTLSDLGWPVTIHCDMGCDNYDDMVYNDNMGPVASVKMCEVPRKELLNAGSREEAKVGAGNGGPRLPEFT